MSATFQAVYTQKEQEKEDIVTERDRKTDREKERQIDRKRETEEGDRERINM